jgi:hypothetical protein
MGVDHAGKQCLASESLGRGCAEPATVRDISRLIHRQLDAGFKALTSPGPVGFKDTWNRQGYLPEKKTLTTEARNYTEAARKRTVGANNTFNGNCNYFTAEAQRSAE